MTVTQAVSSWSDLLQALALKRFPWGGDWLMAVFDIIVCGDESGLHASPSYCVLGGYIGSTRQWQRFNREWLAVLERHDVSRFHAKDFFAFGPGGVRVGRYRRLSDGAQASYGDWPDQEAESYIAGLLDTVDSRNLSPLGAMVDVPAFDEFSYGERKLLTGGHFENGRWVTTGAPSKPYFMLIAHVIKEAAHKTKAGKRILFLFEEQRVYQSRALQQFQESWNVAEQSIKNRLGGVCYLPGEEAPGLQAADLYVHCWHRYATDPARLGDARRTVMNVLCRENDTIRVYDREMMGRMLERVPRPVLDQIRSSQKP